MGSVKIRAIRVKAGRRVGQPMAERRLRYPLLWLGFVALMVAGAAFLSSGDGTMQAVGIGLIVLPLAVFGVVTLAYYLLERFRPSS
jgi:membrane-bound ClpP family serine protease